MIRQRETLKTQGKNEVGLEVFLQKTLSIGFAFLYIFL